VALTPNEKIAGRKFRDDAQAALTASFESAPPTYPAPNFLAHIRHECPGRNDISTALELKEKYQLSPAYYVTDGTAIEVLDDAIQDPGGELIPAGRFAFIYKEGKCKNKGCGHTARSKAGRFVDAHDRPPVEGRVARSSA